MIGLTPTIETASIGIPDTLFLMLLALVVFGPRRLPEIGRQIGKLMYEFRKVSNDFKYQMEEELRASEDADRQRKLQATIAAASPQAALNVAPAVTDVAPLELGSGSDAAVTANIGAESAETVPSVAGEVRGEPMTYPGIQPPATGETIAAQRPFRGRISGEPDTILEAVPATETESGAEATYAVATPVVVADEGRIGTEVQPGVIAGTEREASHA